MGGGAVVGITGQLKWPGVGRKTHSVLEDFEEEPMCIWRPNQAKCVNTRYAPISISRQVCKSKRSIVHIEHTTEDLKEGSVGECLYWVASDSSGGMGPS